MRVEDYEEMTICEKELIDEPCNDTNCIYYDDCLKEYEGIEGGK